MALWIARAIGAGLVGAYFYFGGEPSRDEDIYLPE